MQIRDKVKGLHNRLEMNITFLEKYCYTVSFTSNLFVALSFTVSKEMYWIYAN